MPENQTDPKGEDLSLAEADSTEPVESPPDTTGEAEPARRSSGTARFALLLAFLVLLLLAGATGAGGWYLWQRHLVDQQTAQSLQQLSEQVAGKASRSELEQSGQQPLRELGRVQQALSETQGRVEAQTRRIRQLESRINQNQRGWTLAETLYLLRMADYRLRLAQDRNSSVAALEAADAALARLDEIDLLDVRKALAEEIAMLKRLPRPDPEGVALALAELQESINRLPLTGQSEKTLSQAQEEPATDSGLLASLQKFIVVKRNNREVLSRPEPKRFATARRRLHTAIELARLSALRLDLQVFSDSIEAADQVLKQEFDLDGPAGRQFAETLSAQLGRLQAGESVKIGKARRLLQDFVAAQRPGLEAKR